MNVDDLKIYMPVSEGVRQYIYKNANHGGTCFCKWLQWWHNKLIIRTFAYRCLKRKGIEWTECERAVVGEEYAIRKNLYKTAMGGYHAVFNKNQKASSSSWYGYTYYYFSPDDFDIWFRDKVAGMYSPYINIDYLYTLKKYKYCGYSGKQDLKQYLEAYEKDSAVEYFGKAGIIYTAMLGKKAKKDKAFAKFIIENANKVNNYGFKITEYAYTHKCSFSEAELYCCEKHEADLMFRGCVKPNYKVDRIKIYHYAETTLGRWNYEATYRDYWNACVNLGLDMRDTKNSMPNDFNTMHEIRTLEYDSLKAKLDEKAEREFNKRLKAAAEQYNFDFSNKKYTIRLPQTKSDFRKESQCLHHCVARMGYDGKMASGKIIIAFIRLVEAPDEPYVTVEYSLEEKRIMQIHGIDNCNPNEETRNFAYKWAKKMKGVQKECHAKAI